MVKITKWPSSDKSKGTTITQMTMADMATCEDQACWRWLRKIIHLPHSPREGCYFPQVYRWGNGDTERLITSPLSHSRAGIWTQAAWSPQPLLFSVASSPALPCLSGQPFQLMVFALP